jgi:nucleoside-diphosphate-sugar epimerase
MSQPQELSSVAITGALGSLGWKLLCYLAQHGSFPQLLGLDIVEPGQERLETAHRMARDNATAARLPQVRLIQCDLRDWDDRRWRDAVDEADAVVHFAAYNIWPDAPWPDALVNCDINLNVALAATQSERVRRFVFASSSHATGGYKDPPLSDTIGPGELTTDLGPAVGTVWHDGSRMINSVAYGVSKATGERLCRVLAIVSRAKTTFVCVRIGWTQHGANTPDRIAISWDQDRPTQETTPELWSSDLRWFKELWLSDRDFTHLFERALVADGSDWPNGFIIVNGMSNNAGMKWSLDEAQRWLGYEPQDDVYTAYLPASGRTLSNP